MTEIRWDPESHFYCLSDPKQNHGQETPSLCLFSGDASEVSRKADRNTGEKLYLVSNEAKGRTEFLRNKCQIK